NHTDDFLTTPMYRLVVRAILEKIRTERTPSTGATCSSENSIRTSPDHAPLPGSSRLWLASPTTWISIAPGTTTASSKRGRHSVRPGRPSQSRGTEDLKSSGASLPPRKPRHVKFGRGRPPSGGRELCVAVEPGEDKRRPPTRRGPSEALAGSLATSDEAHRRQREWIVLPRY